MVFDYIDGATGEEHTAQRNREAFGQVMLEPAVLRDLSGRSLATTLFGQSVAMPVVIGPTGMNGSFWPRGDLCLARAAAQAGIPFVLSTAATERLADVTAAAGPLRWFQLYMLRDRGLAGALLERVHAAGFNVLELTVDTAVSGRRPRDIRNGFTLPFRWRADNLLDAACHPRWALAMLRHGSPRLRLFEEAVGHVPRGRTIGEVMQQQISDAFSWRDLDWLRAQWPGRLVLKGVGAVHDVAPALAAGVDGFVVSNHGGRQLDGSWASLERLPAFADAVAGRACVLFDSGVRSGADIAKALALGADAVQLGRATLYGLAAAGEAGVRHALDLLADDLLRTLGNCGADRPAALRGRATRLSAAPAPVA
jgi:(S)-mandelate dehydrogenase